MATTVTSGVPAAYASPPHPPNRRAPAAPLAQAFLRIGSHLRSASDRAVRCPGKLIDAPDRR
ncbi:hypothetical protein ACF08N_21710 [Streptomyces sp. NPDC015127]|uniref:hypothetical protein n=1 Tax=Streptomyces sp. NPDC015127 TaxID=3364939 RepID=UPI0036F9A24F